MRRSLVVSDLAALNYRDIRGNCRVAFEAAEKLGIPRVIEPADMVLLAVPDKLAVMTYLHQLRAHFTGQEVALMQFGGTSQESSYASVHSSAQAPSTAAAASASASASASAASASAVTDEETVSG